MVQDSKEFGEENSKTCCEPRITTRQVKLNLPFFIHDAKLFMTIYGQLNFNEAFSNKLEVVQYSAALAIAGTIRGTSRT